MVTATKKSILSSLTLDTSHKPTTIDTATHRRNNLLTKLDEQVLIAQAMLKGEEYFGKKTVKETDEDGNVSTVTVPKQVRKWFYENNEQWFLEVKYGNKVLQLAKDKTAIVVGKLDDMISVIEQIKQAVLAKELDNAIDAVATKKVK